MWSRRAQEYETKILSGDPVLIAEVLKDLYKKKILTTHRLVKNKFIHLH